jgi:hypothetical protein
MTYAVLLLPVTEPLGLTPGKWSFFFLSPSYNSNRGLTMMRLGRQRGLVVFSI